MHGTGRQPLDSTRQGPLRRLQLLVLPLLLLALIVPATGTGASDDFELVGEVMIEHADGFARGRSEEYTSLETARGRFVLHGPRARGLEAGTRLRVRGKRQGDAVFLGSDSSVTVIAAPEPTETTSTSTSTSTTTSTTSGAPIRKRVVVLLVNFTEPTAPPSPTPSDDGSLDPTPTPLPSPTPVPPAEPWTLSAVHGLYFTNQKSVASYFSEVSNGQMEITGDVFGYFTLAMPTSSCDYAAWGTAAREAAEAAGIDLSAYTNVVHAWAKQSACWWGGMAQLPGRLSWINGSMTLYVTSHELGHNYGAHHASTMTCTQGGKRVPLSSNCTVKEYGDPFDVMGTSAQRHLQTWHRRQLGLLGTSDQLSVTENGHYTVATAQVAGGAPRILRVARPSGDFYYLEFRQPYGLYDNFSTTAAAVNGVMIRIAPDTKRVRSRLIDNNPATSGFGDAALAVGQTFTDAANDISITTVATAASAATVRIQLGPDTVAPSSPGSLTATALSADSVRLDWQPATDDLELAGYRISRDGVVLTTMGGTTFTDSGLAQGVTYAYSVEALDAAANASPPAVVSHHVPDTVAPSAPPAASATQTDARSVSLAWEPATDNVGVVSYLVHRDGSLWTSTSVTQVVDTTVMDGFRYDYAILAVDAAGNVGQGTPVSLTLPDVTPPTAPESLAQLGVSATSAELSWEAASDNVAVAGYRVARDGTLVATLGPDARTFSDTGLASDRSYEYAVMGFDAAGNVGPAMTTTAQTLLSVDTIKPSVPTNLKGEAMPRRYVSLTWTASTDDRPGTIRYRIFRNRVKIATVTTTSYTDRAPTVGWWNYKIRAIDEAGNKSAFTPKISVEAVKAL